MSDNLSNFLGSAEGIPKRVMPMFFIIDTSGSMEGKKIGSVNSAIEELLPDLRKLSDSQADSEIKLAVLKFSTGCEWVTPSLMALNAFDDWEPLESGGLTDLGAALQELNEKLSKNGFMDRGAASSGFYAPVILLLSDGDPTDDYNTPLKNLRENNWFKAALKIGIAIGEDANKDVLTRVTRNKELVFTANNIDGLRKAIKFIAVTSSQIASTSAAVSEDSAGKAIDVKDVCSVAAERQMIEAVKTTMEEDENNEMFEKTESFYASETKTEAAEVDLAADMNDDDDDWE